MHELKNLNKLMYGSVTIEDGNEFVDVYGLFYFNEYTNTAYMPSLNYKTPLVLVYDGKYVNEYSDEEITQIFGESFKNNFKNGKLTSNDCKIAENNAMKHRQKLYLLNKNNMQM